MIIAGIIAEYNPFHSGHRYHIEQTRLKSGADAVVCVMSASFVQRGQPSCFDKFARAEAALKNGADMVLELPAVYSLQGAEFFARGAVNILKACGIITHISFGTEAPVTPGQTDPEALRAALDRGLPYSAALMRGEKPNALLGLEYMRAAEKSGWNVSFLQIPRAGAGHDSTEDAEHLSAACIRQRLSHGLPAPGLAMPAQDFLEPEQMFVPLLCRLRSMSAARLAAISQVSEGLEYKFYEAARSAHSLDELILSCKSKRYTYSRLARIACCAFLDITQAMTDRANAAVPYIRVLGVKKQRRAELLSLLCSHASVPVCTCAADFLRAAPDEAAAAFRAECNATDLRAALLRQAAGSDFTRGLLLV